MGRKIYHPISREIKDQTGLWLVGRHDDGRYQYRSVSVWDDYNIVSLTHEERVGLAVCYALAKLMRPGVTTEIYPMTKARSAMGYGLYNRPRLWLTKSDLFWMGRAYLESPCKRVVITTTSFNTLAHEMGHNTQRGGSKPHGVEFDAAHLKMRVAMKSAVAKGWPKLDMRKLSDSVAPHIRAKELKRKRKSVAASESGESRWTRTLASGEKNLAGWEKKLAAAERKVAAWKKKVKHAQTHLSRAQTKETR